MGSHPDPEAAGGAKLLVVDDDHDVTDLLGAFLQSEGYRIRVAHDGCEGLRLLHDELPDAVVLDVEMPHLDGPQMAYGMIVHDAGMEKIPIVLISGVVDLPAVARRVGTPYLLAKPFGLDELLAVLRRALEGRE